MKTKLQILLSILLSSSVFAQDKVAAKNNTLIPVTGVFAGGCVDNPFSFIAGVQQPLKQHLRISYDVHYWNTKYEDFCNGVYSEGRFSSFTPSVKLIYNTGKRTGSGFFVGLGLGYMFAKDRGTEQSYTQDLSTNTFVKGNDIRKDNWDFSSIAPSFTMGVGFRIVRFPVALSSMYYIAKDTHGWGAMAGGMGITIGFKQLTE